MKKLLFFASLSFIAILTACGGKEKSAGDYPKDFSKMGDEARVAYMMERVSPDSLARFIIYGAMGQNPGAPIDSISIAMLYAYDHLQGDAQDEFSREFDMVTEKMPLAEKMKLMVAIGSEDPQGLGYQLGLEYLSRIREDNKKIKDIDAELAEFKKACVNDSDTYKRFIIGFRVALEADHGKDLAEEVYQKYINLSEEL